MRRLFSHIALVMLFTLSGCFNDKSQEERKKWAVTLDRNDKHAYGTYLAFQSLKYYFPDADIQALSTGFRYTNMDNKMKYNYEGHTLLVLQGLYFYLSEAEWKELKQFVNNGNEVVIFCSFLDDKIEQELGCEKKSGGEEGYDFYSFSPDHNNKGILSIPDKPGKQYGYTGHSIKGFFLCDKDTSSTDNNTPHDTTNSESSNAASDNTGSSSSTSNENNIAPDNNWGRADTLGYVYNEPNFIRYASGDGHITLHSAPLVLSNYFLLQPGNIEYLTALWKTLPKNINRIYWNDYYKRNSGASTTSILWRFPATKLALILGIFAILMYILFEGKRKQRVIPIIAPLKNDSVSFVETVGRLYYNKGDHANLAEKMMQQFLEWVRIHYFLNTNLLNDNFIQQLTIRSGQPDATVRELVYRIHQIRLRDVIIDDDYLYQFYYIIQQFYKNHRI